MKLRKKIIFICVIIFFVSCKHRETILNKDAVNGFQNLIVDYRGDSVKVNQIESFIIFRNNTNDTVKASVSYIVDNYRIIYDNDSINLNFESKTPISIPPHDYEGIASLSILNKKFKRNDPVFINGFEITNIKTGVVIKKEKKFRVNMDYKAKIYKKWGHTNMGTEL